MTRAKYKNQHIKNYYDRINLTVPKGEKNRIKDGSCIAVKDLIFSNGRVTVVSGFNLLISKIEFLTSIQQGESTTNPLIPS